MRARALFGAVALSLLASACGTAATSARERLSLTIQKLTGSVVQLGSWRGYPLVGARLRATVCIRGTTTQLYPDEFVFTHYTVSRSKPPRRWDARRIVRDRPAWLVPFGETWHSKQCGPVVLEDVIPPSYYGAEGFGNPLTCYAVALTIKTNGLRATRRTIVRCGGL